MKRVLAAMTLPLSLIAMTACGGGDPLAGDKSAADTITVGSANFPESQLLAEIYAQALEAKSIKVVRKPDLGSRETYVPALKDGSIDMIPDYTGTLLQYFRKDAPETSEQDVYTALRAETPAELAVLDKASAQDKDAVVITKETAQRLNVKSIADLAPHCKDLVFGGPPEFTTRAGGIPGLAKNYGCNFREYKQLQPGAVTSEALKGNAVQAADIFTTDSTIKANGFVVLEDPKLNFAAQNIVPLIKVAKASESVRNALNAVQAKLDTPILLDLNAKLADKSKPDPKDVAKEWLKSVGLA
ncbi:ABC transporter substrate-binding protein [Pseudonocardiaceae bacterium YIM PH 21723]|nr:ABC transporter substrate-binding protein [Pseudonocardiaceae bacterium YIM PH 21723]